MHDVGRGLGDHEDLPVTRFRPNELKTLPTSLRILDPLKLSQELVALLRDLRRRSGSLHRARIAKGAHRDIERACNLLQGLRNFVVCHGPACLRPIAEKRQHNCVWRNPLPRLQNREPIGKPV